MLTLPTRIRSLYPFDHNRRHYCSVGRGDFMHFVDEGQGEEVVLMLHGNPSWSFLYRDLILKLRGRFRCNSPDHIGCGLSDKPQDLAYSLKMHIDHVHQLLNHLNIRRFHLVMHDWGGAIGMGLALKRLDQVGKLILMNTAAFHIDAIPRRIELCRYPFLGNLLTRGLNAFVRGACQMATQKPLSKDVRFGFAYPYNNYRNRIAIHRFVQDIPNSPDHPSWSLLKEIEHGLPFIKKPVLLCWGGQDFCFDERFLNRWRQIWPHAHVRHFPQAGHYVLEDVGDPLLMEIKTFLDQSGQSAHVL